MANVSAAHHRTDRLDGILTALAAGDRAFLFTFVEHVGAAVERAFAQRGVAPQADLVDDVAFALLRRPRVPGQDAWRSVLAVVEAIAAGEPPPPVPPVPAAQRALHLVDIENLAGGPARIGTTFEASLRLYAVAAALGADDHVVLSADRAVWKRTAWDVPPGWRYLPGTGPDGADRVLLEVAEPDWVVERFGRVVVGSGDHCFAPLVGDLVDRQVEVVVVARPRQLAGALRDSAAEIRALPDLPPVTLAA